MSPLASTYYEIAEEHEAAEEGTGRVWLVAQRDAALTAEQNAAGASLTQEAFDGHASTFTVHRSSEDRLLALQEALRAWDGRDITFTTPSFQCLPH